MSNSIQLPVGSFTAEIVPSVQVKGVVVEYGNGPYDLSLQYYNETIFFSTRPTIDNGSIGEQPEFT